MQVTGAYAGDMVGAAGCMSDRCYNARNTQVMSLAFADLASAEIGKSPHRDGLSFAQNRF